MKNAILFGASSGIGRALAILLAKNGYRVVITGRRKALLEELRKTNPDAFIAQSFDVKESQEIDRFFSSITTKLKTIDLVIHCAGIGYENPELEWEKEEHTIKVNVLAATQIYDLAFNLFKKQGFGHLVSISSIAALRGNRFAPSYFASKAYQVNYLESLYFKTKEIKSNKVYVTDVRPGYVNTRMALGEGIFWMASLNKASKQIYGAIKKKKRRVYISKRWILIAWVLKITPSWIMKKVM
jgi:short-subunit dehydrogenase